MRKTTTFHSNVCSLILFVLFWIPTSGLEGQAPTRTPALQASAQSVLPHLAVGSSESLEVSTSVILINPGDAEATASIFFFASDGTPLQVIFENVADEQQTQGSAFQVTVAGHGIYAADVTSGGPVQDGWARIEATAPVGVLATFTIWSISDGEFSLVTAVGVSATPAGRDFSIGAINVVEEGNRIATAFALCNNSDQTAYVKATLYSGEGEILQETVLEMGPNAHQASFVADIFPEMGTLFIGVLRLVRSDADGNPTSELDLHGLALLSFLHTLSSIPVVETAP